MCKHMYVSIVELYNCVNILQVFATGNMMEVCVKSDVQLSLGISQVSTMYMYGHCLYMYVQIYFLYIYCLRLQLFSNYLVISQL